MVSKLRFCHITTIRSFALAMLLAGCGAADADWAGTVETLPNGTSRVVNPARGLWTSESAWRLVPELVIGEADGPEETTFAAIMGVEADDEGRLYVLDRQANQLRIFAADGSHLRSVGRSGSGPGEYANANGLRWLAADTLLVIDQRGNRYSLLSRDGEYIRSVVRRLPFYAWAFSGGYDSGKVYEQFVVGQEPDYEPALFGTSLRPSERRTQGTGREGDSPVVEAAVDTVYLPKPSGPLFETFRVQTQGGGMVISVPFAAEPVYYLDGRGGVWHGHGSEFRITRSSFTGDTLLQIVLDAEPAPVTAEELAEWESGQTISRFREMGGRLDMSRIPNVKSYFDGLHLDPDGYLWVTVLAGPTEMVFAVVDPTGRYLGRLQANGLVRDSFVPPVVRNGRLYVVARDELDVQRVHVFRIERT
jgi:hypothetical protein